jgi:endonuclease/exonuclease/phosphatase family metal-dependent hydrolase
MLAAMLALFTACPTAQADGQPRPSNGTPTLKVMTRNLYLGGDIFRVLGAPDVLEFERRTQALWNEVRKTNFPFRSKLIAAEVERTRPDLIGLQEVALWRRGPDGVKDGPVTPATRVEYDFLALLRRELNRRGLRYRVEARQQEADIEAPIEAGFDVRLTMRDVILVRARRGLRITGRQSANYEAELTVQTPAGQPLTSKRGWTAVDGRFAGQRFRFVNTHLESALDSTRVAQATELLAPGGPLRVRRPVILLGDMNSDPEGRGGNGAGAYDLIEGGGFEDAWRQTSNAPGLTCCINSDLSDTTPTFDSRIDLIFTNSRRLRPVQTMTVGTRARDRRRNLWPSDHGGVVATLRVAR